MNLIGKRQLLQPRTSYRGGSTHVLPVQLALRALRPAVISYYYSLLVVVVKITTIAPDSEFAVSVKSAPPEPDTGAPCTAGLKRLFLRVFTHSCRVSVVLPSSLTFSSLAGRVSVGAVTLFASCLLPRLVRCRSALAAMFPDAADSDAESRFVLPRSFSVLSGY